MVLATVALDEPLVDRSDMSTMVRGVVVCLRHDTTGRIEISDNGELREKQRKPRIAARRCRVTVRAATRLPVTRHEGISSACEDVRSGRVARERLGYLVGGMPVFRWQAVDGRRDSRTLEKSYE